MLCDRQFVPIVVRVVGWLDVIVGVQFDVSVGV